MHIKNESGYHRRKRTGCGTVKVSMKRIGQLKNHQVVRNQFSRAIFHNVMSGCSSGSGNV